MYFEALRTKVSFPGGMRGRQRACPAHYRGVTPLARDALRMKPTKRLCFFRSRPTRRSLALTRAVPPQVKVRPVGLRRRGRGLGRHAAGQREWDARVRLGLCGGGAILLGPVTALGLVSLLRLTTGRGRPPSGHRYCSNSFFSQRRGRCGRKARTAASRSPTNAGRVAGAPSLGHEASGR